MARKGEVDFSRELPNRNGQEYDWDLVAENLRKTPKEWGMVFEQGKVSTVNAIRQGSVRALASELGFEVKTYRNVRGTPRTCDLWMRYNPDKDDAVKSAIRRSRSK